MMRIFVRRCSAKKLLSSGIRSMSSTHVERTADSSRSDVFSSVSVTDICQLSPTVKGFSLQVMDRKLNFLAGQWVDLHIPNEDIVGGYSISSPPHQLAEDYSIELAIKHSDYPPTLWMTTKCRVGDKLMIRVGGDFHYAPSEGRELTDLLLIGGGVGINPLFSMLSHHVRLLSRSHSNTVGKGSVRMLYSSKTESELLFRDRIEQHTSEQDRVKVQYFVTADDQVSNLSVKCNRITAADVVEVVKGLDHEGLCCYLCGPPPMTEAMMKVLVRNCGLSPNQIFYEKWW